MKSNEGRFFWENVVQFSRRKRTNLFAINVRKIYNKCFGSQTLFKNFIASSATKNEPHTSI